MTTVTTAALSRDPGEPFSLEQVTLDGPRADEILVRIVASGICHTDLVSRAAGSSQRPVLLGHEGAGIVEEVGAQVASVRPGDHVVLTFRHCGDCRNCAAGRPAYCLKANALNTFGARADRTSRVTVDGARVLDGFFGQSSLAGYALSTEDNTVVVDPSIDLALAAPLGCGFQTGAGAVLNVLAPEGDSWLALFGAGAVGMAALLAAATVDGLRTVVVETSPQRRDLAIELGAAEVIDPAGGGTAERIRELTGTGAAHAVDTTGIPAVLGDAVRALAVGGTVVALGLGSGTPPVDVRDMVMNGKSIRGCLEGDSVPSVFIPQLLELHRAGRFPLERLVSVYPGPEIDVALNDQRAGKIVKPVLRW
ncbi:NAD(P)-dependent alcohol dehydrogenase [Nocardia higoensis]|uniref:NAD(P)-dependent alcohol dehydrogenase n=1 Tax=Nocardia higoensis TaxID=228599 RepID=A0ABS0D4P0_9NOCA|nr:NAD(P)-dependent alcohol dehydrogenase [Nocardia higoensis]MBF6353455.1 NAD(P)-dependent alcohol dehydrogenase [Nocardia higoensis]